jgi:hypothetical protein
LINFPNVSASWSLIMVSIRFSRSIKDGGALDQKSAHYEIFLHSLMNSIEPNRNHREKILLKL